MAHVFICKTALWILSVSTEIVSRLHTHTHTKFKVNTENSTLLKFQSYLRHSACRFRSWRSLVQPPPSLSCSSRLFLFSFTPLPSGLDYVISLSHTQWRILQSSLINTHMGPQWTIILCARIWVSDSSPLCCHYAIMCVALQMVLFDSRVLELFSLIKLNKQNSIPFADLWLLYFWNSRTTN